MLNINVSVWNWGNILSGRLQAQLTGTCQPAMRPSTQQLLKIEQLMYAKKLIDVNKM